MVSKIDSNKKRLKRHRRARARLAGTSERPRLCVFRSLQNVYAQIIDDEKGVTLCAASTAEKDFTAYGGNKEAARLVGKTLAARAKEKGISSVVFDRSGYIYHGRVKELAEGAREGGLEF